MAELGRHQKVVINLSLQILEAAIERAKAGKVDTIEVRLALRCLLPHCRERWPLTSFWSSASSERAYGRSEGCYAAFNGIKRQVDGAT